MVCELLFAGAFVEQQLNALEVVGCNDSSQGFGSGFEFAGGLFDLDGDGDLDIAVGGTHASLSYPSTSRIWLNFSGD